MCKSSEVTNQQLKSIQNDEKKDTDELNFVCDKRRSAQGKKPSNQKKPPIQKKAANKSWKCKYRGRKKKYAKPIVCPAHGQKYRICKKMNHFARMCQSSKEKAHVAEEAEGYESDKSMLQLEEITAISGSGKQLTSSITFIVDQKYKEQLVCQLDTEATCNVISHRSLVQLLQNSDPSLLKYNSQLKLFDSTLISPVGEITLSKGNHRDLRFQVVNKPLLSAETCEEL